MVFFHRSGINPTDFILIALFTIASIAYPGAYSGGSGTAEDPYRISTAGNWQELTATPYDWDKFFILATDIDLAGVAVTPVGMVGSPFIGVFDGNGHVIRNAIIHLPDNEYVGLFGHLGSDGRILNLAIVGADIQGHGYVGGLAGQSDGTIGSCYATGTVSGGSCIGGLVGYIYSGTITSCYTRVAVSGAGYRIGGLAGWNSTGIITACYASGTVGGSIDVGGLVGANYAGPTNACFWDIQTSGQAGSSSGKGLTTAQMKTLSIFQNAGWANQGWVMDDGVDYPRLAWEDTGAPAIPESGPIPLAGSGTAADPFLITTAEEFARVSWYSSLLGKHIRLMGDLDLSGTELDPIGDLGQFTGVFDGNGHILDHAIIHQPGDDYVGLFGLLGAGGRIQNLGITDVDIQGRSYVGGLVGFNEGAITLCDFAGTISGNMSVGGLTGVNYWNGDISLSCSTGSILGKGGNSVGGLAGYNCGDISSCCVSGAVNSTGPYVGGLAGYLYSGKVTSSSAVGSVNGMESVGGLVGYNTIGSISACYAGGGVDGEGSVGGVTGTNEEGTIASCYAIGDVQGISAVGGLVGDNGWGIIASCYSTGKVDGESYVGGLVGWSWSTVADGSFWNTDTSGLYISDGGTGKTTAEMKGITTFTGAGWDFVGEAANGTGDVWRMCRDGISYPRLSWEYSRGGDMDCPDGVGMEDLVYLAGRWMGSTPETAGAADGDGSGKVDLNDFILLSEQWMK